MSVGGIKSWSGREGRERRERGAEKVKENETIIEMVLYHEFVCECVYCNFLFFFTLYLLYFTFSIHNFCSFPLAYWLRAQKFGVEFQFLNSNLQIYVRGIVVVRTKGVFAWSALGVI